MGKKNKNKDVSRLRAEVEFLRAQLKSSGNFPERTAVAALSAAGKIETVGSFNRSVVSPSKTAFVYRIEPDQLRSDLRKTVLLTVLSLAFLFTLYFTQPYLPAFSRSVSRLLQNSPLKIPAIK